MRLNLSLSQVSFFLFCLFPLLPTLPTQSALAIVFVVLQLIVAIKGRENWQKKSWWFPLWQSLPVVILALSLLYTANIQNGAKYLERSILLIVLPWLFFLNRKHITRQTQASALRVFTLVVTVFCLYVITAMLLTGKFFETLPLPNSYYYIREFISSKSGMHPTYFSMLLALGVFAIQDDLKNKARSIGYKITAGLCFLILILGLLLATSKMVLAATVVGSAVVWSDKLNLKTMAIWSLVALGAFATLIVTVSPLRDRADDLWKAFSQEQINDNNPDSMRRAIYQSGWEATKENAWFGVGAGDVQMALDENYERFGFTDALERHYNTHNYYLHIWLATGIIPAILFVLLQLVHVLIGWYNRNLLHVAVALLFAFCMLSENILSRQVGIFMYAFFTSFLAFASWSKNEGLIFINGRFLTQSTSGVQRFAHEVVANLQKLSNQYVLVCPKTTTLSPLPARRVGPFQGVLWEQFTLPLYLRFIGSPKFLGLCNTAPIYYPYNYVTLHDAAFMANPNWFSEKFVKWYQFMVPKVLKKSQHVFTVSQFSKNEIVKYFGVEASKITVAYNGVPRFTAHSGEETPLVNGQYALVVGTLSKRKNQSFIIDSFQALGEDFPLKLVLAGQIDDSLYGADEDVGQKIDQASHIIWKENPSDSDLHNLYQHAFCVIYMPSYEGFGLPVLEGLCYGKPTIVSDISVFRELYQDLVLFSPLQNHNHLQTILKQLINTADLENLTQVDCEELNERFSYENTASIIHRGLHSGDTK